MFILFSFFYFDVKNMNPLNLINPKNMLLLYNNIFLITSIAIARQLNQRK